VGEAKYFKQKINNQK